MTCRLCGLDQAEQHFALLPSGNRRRVCNHCRWCYSVKPSRQKGVLRNLSARKTLNEQPADYADLF